MEPFRWKNLGTEAVATAPACKILDDDELEAQTKQIEWRKGADKGALFSSPPKMAFQTYRAALMKPVAAAVFPYVKPKVVHKTTETFRPLMETPMTPESIAEFGVPMLPMPDMASLIEAINTDEDGDYRYATCTPPPERAAPAVSAEVGGSATLERK